MIGPPISYTFTTARIANLNSANNKKSVHSSIEMKMTTKRQSNQLADSDNMKPQSLKDHVKKNKVAAKSLEQQENRHAKLRSSSSEEEGNSGKHNLPK